MNIFNDIVKTLCRNVIEFLGNLINYAPFSKHYLVANLGIIIAR